LDLVLPLEVLGPASAGSFVVVWVATRRAIVVAVIPVLCDGFRKRENTKKKNIARVETL
jgi:hypothetical protein